MYPFWECMLLGWRWDVIVLGVGVGGGGIGQQVAMGCQASCIHLMAATEAQARALQGPKDPYGGLKDQSASTRKAEIDTEGNRKDIPKTYIIYETSS